MNHPLQKYRRHVEDLSRLAQFHLPSASCVYRWVSGTILWWTVGELIGSVGRKARPTISPFILMSEVVSYSGTVSPLKVRLHYDEKAAFLH